MEVRELSVKKISEISGGENKRENLENYSVRASLISGTSPYDNIHSTSHWELKQCVKSNIVTKFVFL